MYLFTYILYVYLFVKFEEVQNSTHHSLKQVPSIVESLLLSSSPSLAVNIALRQHWGSNSSAELLKISRYRLTWSIWLTYISERKRKKERDRYSLHIHSLCRFRTHWHLQHHSGLSSHTHLMWTYSLHLRIITHVKTMCDLTVAIRPK